MEIPDFQTFKSGHLWDGPRDIKNAKGLGIFVKNGSTLSDKRNKDFKNLSHISCEFYFKGRKLNIFGIWPKWTTKGCCVPEIFEFMESYPNIDENSIIAGDMNLDPMYCNQTEKCKKNTMNVF